MDVSEAPLHVVFGAGQVGYPLADRLLGAGRRVRVVKRSPGNVPEGCEVVLGDAADTAFCVSAARGAAAVYHCMNPPYDTRVWAEMIPRYMDNLIEAAAGARARLIVLDNLYMYGHPGRPIDEDTPVNPRSRKGEIRARAAERLFEAHRRGSVRATAGRASDFYGPGGTQSLLGDYFWPTALAGKPAYSPHPADVTHTFHYIPDVAAALANLGNAEDDAFGRPWMLPCGPAVTLRQLAERIAAHLRLPVRIVTMPRWMLKAMGLFLPLMRELGEMRHQWEEPFVVDDRRFRERFAVEPEPPEPAARRTAEWVTRHYGARAAARH